MSQVTGALPPSWDTALGGSSTQQNRAVLGQDAFLQLLVKQLEYQDPMSPMQDREFIVQMAQFQSLESMMQMNQKQTAVMEILQGIRELLGESSPNSIQNLPLVSTLIGREVHWLDGEEQLSGVVSSVVRGENEWLLRVDDTHEVPVSDVFKVL